jgi:rod shape-determining protein MreB
MNQLSPLENQLWQHTKSMLDRRKFLQLVTISGAVAVLTAMDTALAKEEPAPFFKHGSGMIVDIGGSTTEVAVFSLGGIVVRRSTHVAGDKMDEDIIQYVRSKYYMLIGAGTAEYAKIDIGSAYLLIEERTKILRGRNLITGLPEAREVSSIEVREALSRSVSIIVDAIRDTLDNTPPELMADLMEAGICIAGGGGQLKGMAQRITHDLNIRTWLSDELSV